MKKRISALLLSLVLCFSLVGTTFAREILDDEGNIYEEKEPTKPDPRPDPTPSTSDDDDDDDGYRISTPSRTPGGKVQVRPGSASQGTKVTIIVTPDDGYELDTLTVKDAKGNTLTLTDEGGGKYTFIMPASRVTVSATFKRAASTGGSFTDVPASHAFYDDISWVAARGYMGGYSDGTFRPSANTTRQALWMVLARIAKADPANMAAAKDWAVENGISDGSNAGNSMSRQQLVAMLYRFAQAQELTVEGVADLSGYPDNAGLASYAKDAMAWAVENGIVTGTSDGRLNPEGTASRAQFAVILYRFANLTKAV